MINEKLKGQIIHAKVNFNGDLLNRSLESLLDNADNYKMGLITAQEAAKFQLEISKFALDNMQEISKEEWDYIGDWREF